MKKNLITALLVIMFSHNIFANELKIAEFSTKCSALFYLMTMNHLAGLLIEKMYPLEEDMTIFFVQKI